MHVPALIQIVILKAVCRFVVSLLSFSIFAAGFFPLPLATLLLTVLSSSTLIEIQKKIVSNRLIFPGNLDPSSLTPGGSVVPLLCRFSRRDNLAWRELFANLYELKSRV